MPKIRILDELEKWKADDLHTIAVVLDVLNRVGVPVTKGEASVLYRYNCIQCPDAHFYMERDCRFPICPTCGNDSTLLAQAE